MKKSILILIGIVLIVLIIFLGKEGIEYVATANRIKNSETYSRNEFIMEYNEENYVVKIPKGLGDLQLKGNVTYAFKSLKSVDEIKMNLVICMEKITLWLKIIYIIIKI